MARFVELRRPGPDRPAAAGAVDGPTLAARLHEIGAAAAEPVDTLEPALHAILEATGAAAGAVCLFDARREVLRLAAEEGLSDEGCHQLRTVRRGDIASWDMPLHGLMNRRAYLIESAAQNRYVPPLVEAGAAIRTVACLPVYAGSVPVGSLVLITRTPRAFTERDLGGLQQPLREMAQLIEAVRRQASERAAAETPSLTAVPSPTPPTAARSEAPSAPESAPADAGHDGSLAAALAAAQRENARLAMELERLRAEAPRDAVRLTEQTAEIDHLRAQLAEAEAGAAHEQRAREEIEAALARGSSGGHAELQLALDTARRAETARAALAAEHARLTAELERLHAGATHEELAGEHAAEVDRLRARLAEAEAGAAHEHRAREQLEAALERGASVGQLELRQALEAARQAEAARATLAAEKARLGDELERWRAEAVRAEPLKEALAHAETEHARLAAALEAATAERAEENRTEAARAQAKAAEHEAEMERVLARLAEAEATAAREERARRALDAASEHEGSAQSNDVRQALEAARTAEEARDAAAIALAAATADLTRTLAQLEALREDAAGAHRELERLVAHERGAREERERLERELEDRRGHEHTLSARLEERERDIEARATEGAATAAQLETVTGECDHLRAAVATLEAERDRLTADVEGAAAARVRLEEALAGALEEARARDQVLTGQLEVRTRESEALRSEHAAEVAATNARLETIINECDQLRTAAEALQAGRDRLAADVRPAARGAHRPRGRTCPPRDGGERGGRSCLRGARARARGTGVGRHARRRCVPRPAIRTLGRGRGGRRSELGTHRHGGASRYRRRTRRRSRRASRRAVDPARGGEPHHSAGARDASRAAGCRVLGALLGMPRRPEYGSCPAARHDRAGGARAGPRGRPHLARAVRDPRHPGGDRRGGRGRVRQSAASARAAGDVGLDGLECEAGRGAPSARAAGGRRAGPRSSGA
ncbi:MAG: hypothetical protein E6J81_07405 [Deltaproteobacteria bacterium]|nr:MAG: hypothetical protein E6J81_07405 [Deltaproteobacteria bacterium]